MKQIQVLPKMLKIPAPLFRLPLATPEGLLALSEAIPYPEPVPSPPEKGRETEHWAWGSDGGGLLDVFFYFYCYCYCYRYCCYVFLCNLLPFLQGPSRIVGSFLVCRLNFLSNCKLWEVACRLFWFGFPWLGRSVCHVLKILLVTNRSESLMVLFRLLIFETRNNHKLEWAASSDFFASRVCLMVWWLKSFRF